MFRLFNVRRLEDRPGRYDLHEAAQIGVELAKWITDIYQTWGLFCITLEFEKVYETWLLKSKKCYAVYKHLFDIKTGKLTASLSSSGLESVRRDVTLFTKELYERVIKMTVQDRNLDGAIRLVQKQFTDLKNGFVPLEKLVITGGFSKRADQYKAPTAHIEAVRKQMEVDPNKAPTVGSRIDWVIASLGTPEEDAKCKTYEQAVMPEYLNEHGLKLDYNKYVIRCAKPFCRFFAPALAPKMSGKEGQVFVMQRVFVDYFQRWDEMEKRKKSPLVASFARGILTNGKHDDDKHEDEEEEEQEGDGREAKVISMDEALLSIDPSRAKLGKKRRTDPQEIANDRKAFSSAALTTEASTMKDWAAAEGIANQKRGTRYIGH